jgi:alanyl-tRNA synthetase
MKEPFLYKLVAVLQEQMGKFFPGLAGKTGYRSNQK